MPSDTSASSDGSSSAPTTTTRKRSKRLSPEFSPGHTPSAQYIADLLQPYRFFISSLPFTFFALESIFAVVCQQMYGDSDGLLKLMFTQLLAINSTFAGLLHFYPPLREFYTSMIFLPFQSFWLYSTGLAFIFSGLMIAFTKTQILGSWILLVNLILVFPGNIVCVFDPNPRNQVCAGSTTGAVIRLLFQFSFLLWAYWLTSGPIALPSF